MVRSRARKTTTTARKAKAKVVPFRGPMTPGERHRLISETAYFKAERRGFHDGNPEQDWFEAEAEVDAMLTSIEGGR